MAAFVIIIYLIARVWLPGIRRVHLVCKVCGLAVRKKRRTQKYCSAKCQDVAKKRRRRARTGDAIGRIPRSGDRPIGVC